MKVYQVTKSYFDGDHDHGSYRSPLFLNRDDAEDFKKQVTPDKGDDTTERKHWYSDDDWSGYVNPQIVEMEVIEHKVKAKDCKEYRKITYT